MICNPHQILLGLPNQDECDEQGIWHVWRRGEERRGEVYTGFWWGYLRERDPCDHPGLDGRRVLK